LSWGNEVEIKNLNNYFLDANKRFKLHAGEEYCFDLKCEDDYLRAYNLCPPLKAIIGKRAKAFNSGITKIINTNTEKEATGRTELKDLLKRPNFLQTGDQFFSQQNHYIDIFGYCPVLKIKAAGTEFISSMWNIPPWLFDIDYTRKWLMQTKIEGVYSKYYIYWNGEKVELKFKDLNFIYDDGIGTDTDSNLLIPDSRLISLQYPVSNIVASYKARNTLATKRGAIGILSNESEDADGTMSLKSGEKEQIQKDFSRYGLVGQPYQIIISDAKLKWQQMGFATKDLMLFEEVQDDIDRLCDSYGWPPELLARSKDTTFDNKKQARKDVIDNTIIPESYSRMQQFTEIVAPDDTISIVNDYSDLMVFQEDEKLKSEARMAANLAAEKEYKNGLITKNQWLQRLGEPTVEDESFNQYYEEPKEKKVKELSEDNSR
jgi:hypothetical protein